MQDKTPKQKEKCKNNYTSMKTLTYHGGSKNAEKRQTK